MREVAVIVFVPRKRQKTLVYQGFFVELMAGFEPATSSLPIKVDLLYFVIA